MDIKVLRKPTPNKKIRYPGLYEVTDGKKVILVVTMNKRNAGFIFNNPHFANITTERQTIYYNPAFSESLAKEVYIKASTIE